MKLALKLASDGKISEVWVEHPIGIGMDEEALKVVSQYHLGPAMYRGETVGFLMQVELNFGFN